MKILLATLLFPVLLKTCENIPETSGVEPRPLPRVPDRNIGAQDGSDTQHAPIDGGLSVLLVAGAAYGVKRYRDTKQKHKDI